MKTWIKCLCLIFLLTSTNNVFAQIPEQLVSEWEVLTSDGGEWISTDNTGENYDAWGMIYTWGLGKKTLNISLYAIKDDKNLGKLWDYKVYYQPVDQKIILEQWASDGSFGKGEIWLKDSLQSENVSTFYNPDGSTFGLKHVQEIKGDLKTSQTYIKGESGDWVKAQYYEWRRAKPGKSGK